MDSMNRLKFNFETFTYFDSAEGMMLANLVKPNDLNMPFPFDEEEQTQKCNNLIKALFSDFALGHESHGPQRMVRLIGYDSQPESKDAIESKNAANVKGNK